MTTDTDIANRALDILKEAPITSIDDARPIAMWLKRNFASSRDAILAEAEWNFARKRVSLPADSETPAFGWCYSYTLPSDFIRLIPLTCHGYPEGDPIPYEVESGKILTNAKAPLPVRYVFRNEDCATYPATFQEAVAARLAGRMAHWLTGKSSFLQIAQNIYNDAMNKAWLHDATEATWPRAADDDWMRARW